MGGYTSLLANGQLADHSQTFYRETGYSLSARREDGSEYREHWQKYRDHPGYLHAVMCPSTEGWQNKLVEIAEYVSGLEVDGMIFDQVGFGGPTCDFCFATSHGHQHPARAIGPGILENLVAIERKTLDDLVGCLTRNRERFERELHRGRALEYFALVIEASLSDILRGRYRSQMTPQSAMQSLLVFSVRYRLPIFFTENRVHGQRTTESLLLKYAQELEKRFKVMDHYKKGG